MRPPPRAPDALTDPAAASRWRQQAFTYQWLMPAIGRLPMPWAYTAARWRGRWASTRGRDWVELSLGLRYIRERTEAAWRSIRPQADSAQVAAWATARYQTWVEEELEAEWIRRGRWQRFRGLDLAAASQALTGPADQGLVLVQGHFNNPTLACAAVGMASSRPVWMTVSGIYEHAQVHPRLQDLFRGKYRGVEGLLNGGRLLHSESPSSMRQLYRALERGEIVIVVADLPPEPGADGVCVPWVGGHRLLAAGAQRLVSRTGSRVGSLWLQAPSAGQWSLHAELAPAGEPLQAVRQAYGRLGEVLQTEPGRWWAAHLWPDTPRCTLNPTAAPQPVARPTEPSP